VGVSDDTKFTAPLSKKKAASSADTDMAEPESESPNTFGGFQLKAPPIAEETQISFATLPSEIKAEKTSYSSKKREVEEPTSGKSRKPRKHGVNHTPAPKKINAMKVKQREPEEWSSTPLPEFAVPTPQPRKGSKKIDMMPSFGERTETTDNKSSEVSSFSEEPVPSEGESFFTDTPQETPGYSFVSDEKPFEPKLCPVCHNDLEDMDHSTCNAEATTSEPQPEEEKKK